MPHIAHPTFDKGRIREIHTEQGWMKYVPAGPEGGLETYQFDVEDRKFDDRMNQLRYFLLGYVSVGELTLVSDKEKNLIVYGSETAPQ
jgi:hypothetical protein